MAPIIEIRNVWKQYHLQVVRPRTLKEAAVHLLRPKADWELGCGSYWALRDVSLTVQPGDTLGLIGTNGSGKSTLLKLITGISRPTRGHVGVGGRVSALLELGAGFHPDFTGRENIFINGTILGLSKKQIRERYDAIVEFSELQAYIDQPVKTYSSGMYMRLGFSVAIHVDPQILVIDEVLAVGDAAFQEKCMDAIFRIRDSGVTIVFVSHSADAVEKLCRTAAWLEQGELKAFGPTSEVVGAYNEQVEAAIARNRTLDPVAPDSVLG